MTDRKLREISSNYC